MRAADADIPATSVCESKCARRHHHPACAGHSVNALQGMWQKNKDVYWYTRDTGDRDAAEAAELLAVKQREEDLMAEVLCMHPHQSGAYMPTVRL